MVLRIVLFRRAEPIVAAYDGLCRLWCELGMEGGGVKLTPLGGIVVVLGFILALGVAGWIEGL
jgi:hypothetical protein